MLKNKLMLLNKKELCKTSNIPYPTLYRWSNLKGLDHIVKFIELLIHLNINCKDFVKWYNEKKQETD